MLFFLDFIVEHRVIVLQSNFLSPAPSNDKPKMCISKSQMWCQSKKQSILPYKELFFNKNIFMV